MHDKTQARSTIVAISVMAALYGVAHCGLADADNLLAQHDFSIPEQSLDTALLAFSEQAKVHLLMWAGSQSETRSQGANGRLPAQTALQSVLERTGYSFEPVDGDTVAIVHTTSSDDTAGAGVVPVRSGVSGAMAATAQTVPANEPGELQEVIVTGSRVLRDGFESPTPVTVIGVEQIQAAAPENVADFVNRLPAVINSQGPTNNTISVGAGSAGVNTLNLRALGSERTLVLLDGQRSVGSGLSGLVNVNDFPQQLISRVDVVTGGASAAYGSDALTGVVNFVLDKSYVGFKGEVSGGVTTHGDDESDKIAMTYGSAFAGGRGHLLLSGEASSRDGIEGQPRDWAHEGWAIINNPAYGTGPGRSTSAPERLVRDRAGMANAALGGIITNTALRGTAFGPNGVPYQYNYGELDAPPYNVGGDYLLNDVHNYSDMDPRSIRRNAFGRVSFEISDDVEIYGQVQSGYSRSTHSSARQFNIGNITIQRDNAFIPDSVRARMVDLNIQRFTLGTHNIDAEKLIIDNRRYVNRYVVGGSGKFVAMTTDWTWDAYYQKGISRNSERGYGFTVTSRYNNAVDAVVGPNGDVVCRSTLTDPANGCQPYNVMGIGVNSQEAIDYITGSPDILSRDQRLVQDVAAVTVNGEPFSTWAGPVSVAAGVEHRKESISGRSDSISQRTGWFAGNFLATFGSYKVTEGFLETVVPLAKDAGWARALDFNAAVRATDYSVSGYVTTWKAGATYTPIDGMLLRMTRSRDIRAPNLGDLYTAGTTTTGSVLDPLNGNRDDQTLTTTAGNTGLVPEEADTTGVGIVLQPSFWPGFSASIDYFNIDLKGGIGSVNSQAILDRCYEGQAQYCGAIVRSPGALGADDIERIIIRPYNIATRVNRGIDFEASYSMQLADLIGGTAGALELRFLASHYLKNFLDDSLVPAIEYAGANASGGTPSWIWNTTVGYSTDSLRVSLTGRGISSGKYLNSNIECTTDCPVSSTFFRTVDNNRISSVFYMDASIGYKFRPWADGIQMEGFFNVTNMLDQDPPRVAQTGFPYMLVPTNPSLYDVIGRMFRAGVRFGF